MSWIEKEKINSEKKFLALLKKQEKAMKYNIPKELKKAEVPYLQKERNNIYKRQNKKYDIKFGKIMEQIYSFEHEKYYVGIHRTCNDVNKIMKEGIAMKKNLTDINNHVQIIKNFPFMLEQIEHANEYKGSTAVLILKIPKKDIDCNYETMEERDPIYYQKDGTLFLDPKYIVGFVPNNGGEISDFIFNDVIDKNVNIYPHYYDDSISNLQNKKSI